MCDVVHHNCKRIYLNKLFFFSRTDCIFARVSVSCGFCTDLFYFIVYLQGLIARIDGNLQESLQYLQKAIEFNPTNLDNLKEIAKTL